MEREISESSLARITPYLSKGQITKASKKYASKCVPKYRAFSIMQNQIEDVVKKSTQIWNVIYGLSTRTEEEEDPDEEKHEEIENVESDKEEDVEKEFEKDDQETTEEQQPE